MLLRNRHNHDSTVPVQLKVWITCFFLIIRCMLPFLRFISKLHENNLNYYNLLEQFNIINLFNHAYS